MELVSVRGLEYHYPNRPELALRHVDLSLEGGELALFLGPSGSGKSTLLRALTGLVPQFYGGRYRGRVLVAGHDAATTPVREMASIAGLLFQEPESQAIADTVEEDVAFALEQRCLPGEEMERRISRCLELTGTAHLRRRLLSTLSGGERQRAAIAATLSLEPRLLLLDEPSSQLDPEGLEGLITTLGRLREEAGVTVLVAEHRLQRWLPLADRVFALRRGCLQELRPEEAALLPEAPPVCDLGHRLCLTPRPLDVATARTALARLERSPHVRPLPGPSPPGEELIAVRRLTVSFNETPALAGVSLELRAGETVAIVGPNGSGKSTLLRAIAGLAPVSEGSIEFSGRPAPARVPERTAFAGLCPQAPGDIVSRETVADEVRSTLKARRSRLPETEVLERWGLSRLAPRDPRDLSTGERERVATAAMLAHEPRVWLLDEPSRGTGKEGRERLTRRLQEHAEAGGCSLVATHDIEAAARFASRVVGLSEGRVAFDLPAREAFGSDGPLPTQVARVVPGALVAEEVSW